MSDPESPDLEARVAYLEGQNEGLKRVGALALLLIFILGAIVVHQAWADLRGISTSGVVFQDESRMFHGALTITPSGHLGLVPVNLGGTLPALQSYQGLDLQGLAIYDNQGRARILLGVTSQDQPVMAVVGEDGRAVWSPLPAPGPAGQPGAAPPAPGAPPPPGKPGAPATPGAHAPGGPATPGAASGGPATPGAAPGAPATPGAAPGAPATPGAPPGAPATPGKPDTF